MSSQVYLVARNLPIIRENYYYFKVILGLFQLFMWVKYWKVTTAVMLLLTLLCLITCPLLNKKTAWSSKWIMVTAKSDQNFAGKGIALWENHLLRCWDCLSINWIGAVTVSQMHEPIQLDIGALIAFMKFCPLRLLFISMNLSCRVILGKSVHGHHFPKVL